MPHTPKPQNEAEVADTGMNFWLGEYDRNRRYPVKKGTRYVQVLARFPDGEQAQATAAIATTKAYDLATQAFGEFRHDQVQYTVTILTRQVLVELRLFGEGD